MTVSAQAGLSVETLSAVLGGLVDGVLVFDDAGRVVYANPASLAALGLDATSMRVADLEHALDVRDPAGGPLPPEDTLGAIVSKGEQVEDVHVSLGRPDRRRAWGISVSPVRLGASVLGSTLVLRDVTERERLGRQLRESERQLSTVLDRIADGFLSIDAQGTIEFVNDVGLRILQRRREDLLGKNVWEAFPRALGTKLFEGWQTAMREQVAITMEEYFPRRGLWLEVRGYPSPDGLTAYFADVSERRRAEEDLRLAKRLSETLNRINRAIDSELDFDNIMATVVRQSAEALGADVAGVVRREGDGWVGRYLYGIPLLTSIPISERDYHHLEAVAGSLEPSVIRDTLADPQVDPQVASRYGIRALVAIRLELRGELVGILGFGYTRGPLEFDDTMRDFVEKLAAIVSLGLQNSRLLAAEQHVSQTLQSAMLALTKGVHGIDFGTLYRSASETARVGGDFYDVYDLPGGKVALVIGDISGKGLEAAAMTSLVKNTVRAYAEEGHGPAMALQMSNTVIVGASGHESFATLFFGILDTETGELVYCSAGHPPPLIDRRRDGVEQLDVQSSLVGAIENVSFEEGRTHLGHGDVLLMYTDGATEARCADGLLGEERLAAFFDTLHGVRAKQVPERVHAFVKSCTGGTLTDDLAVLAVELKR